MTRSVIFAFARQACGDHRTCAIWRRMFFVSCAFFFLKSKLQSRRHTLRLCGCVEHLFALRNSANARASLWQTKRILAVMTSSRSLPGICHHLLIFPSVVQQSRVFVRHTNVRLDRCIVPEQPCTTTYHWHWLATQSWCHFRILEATLRSTLKLTNKLVASGPLQRQ